MIGQKDFREVRVMGKWLEDYEKDCWYQDVKNAYEESKEDQEVYKDPLFKWNLTMYPSNIYREVVDFPLPLNVIQIWC